MTTPTDPDRTPSQPIRSLIVLGSSLTGLAVVRAAQRSGLRCTMLDDRVGPAARTRRARFHRLPSNHLEDVLEGLSELRGRADVALIAESDRWVRFVREHHRALSAEGWYLLHPDPPSLDICLDKSAFLRWCAERNLPAPRTYDPSGIGPDVLPSFPLMLRPEWTQHSGGTGLPKALEIHSAPELAHWLERYSQAGVQPNLSDSLLSEGLRQFSVAAARDGAGRVCTFLAEKVRPAAEACAGGTYVRPAEHEGIEALAERALHELDFLGVAEVEILFDPVAGKPHLVEINARPWLQYGLPVACGYDLLAYALGRQTGCAASKGRSHAWLDFSSDLYACFSRTEGLVTSGRLRFFDYLRSMAAADVYSIWDWRDPMPLLTRVLRRPVVSIRRLARFG